MDEKTLIINSLWQFQQEMTSLIQEFAKTELFQHYALFFIMVYAGTPSFFFMPNEFLTVPAYVLGVNPIAMIIAIGVGGFLGDTLIFHFAHHFHNFIKKKKNRLETINHWLIKHRRWIFLLSPSLFFGIGDMILVIGGIRHIRFRSIAFYLFIGNVLRGTWGILLVVYGIDLLRGFF